ncbi:MAG TPA: hypothetical protein VJB37_03270 [Patescibacteria group bacterium]|nr:hypothetical protein [Patescibacteria group bacterium]
MSSKFYPLKLYFRAWPNLVSLVLSLLIDLFLFVWLFWEIRPQEELIFLHYNILFGVDYVGEWWKIIYLPLGGIGILLINGFLGWWLFRRDRFSAYVLNGTTLLGHVFLAIIASLLIFLNV